MRPILPWFLLLAAGPVLAGEAEDGLLLTMDKTLIPGEVRLDFAGKPPTYVIYRATDAATLPGRGSERARTIALSFVDAPPPADLHFYYVASEPDVLRNTMSSAQDLAGYMETNRKLQDLTPYPGQSLNPAQFLWLASKNLLAMTSADAFPALSAPALSLPQDPYPSIALLDGYFDRSFTKDEYLALFRQIDDDFELNGSYPESWVVDGTAAEVRFSQAVYWAALLMRAQQLHGALPPRMNRYVISPIGQVPWDVPAGVEEYTSALEISDGPPFWPTNPRRYYTSAAHQYNMLKLGREIYGNTRNVYKAGEDIYNWVMNRWQFTVGYSGGKLPYRNDQDGWSRANHFTHTSGSPKFVTSSIMRAVGIPASVAGAAYFSNRGWVNIDVHAPYGSDPLENDFYYDDIPPPTRNMTYPTQNDDFILRINEIVAEPGVTPAAGERRSVYANPRDVLDYGPAWVVDHLGEDFDTVVLTVKSVKGKVYFAGSGWPEREEPDALGPLIQEAHARGKKVYAAFNTLTDVDTGRANSDQRQWLNEAFSSSGDNFPNINISPCVASYQARLESLLQNLVTNYDVDGVVLESLYFANIYGNTDTEGHPDCPTGADWMRGVIRDYAADLAAAIRGVDPSVEVVISSYPRGHNNQWPGFADADWGHQDMAMLSGVVDRVMLNFGGTNWVHSDPAPWLTLISDFRALTGIDPWASFKLVDEWEYTPRFYRGVANLSRGEGISGFNVHTALSAMGELSPALTRAQWEKVFSTGLKSE